jgi:hypothetical protein
MASAGRFLILAGLCFVGLGGLLVLLAQLGLPLGRLPGDINVRGERLSFHFPLITCLILSVILTLAINLVVALLRR